MEILDMKNTTDIRNSMDDSKIKLCTAEDRNSELKAKYE